MLNCYTKFFTLDPGREKLRWEGEYKLTQANIISSICARKLIEQGYLAYFPILVMLRWKLHRIDDMFDQLQGATNYL